MHARVKAQMKGMAGTQREDNSHLYRIFVDLRLAALPLA